MKCVPRRRPTARARRSDLPAELARHVVEGSLDLNGAYAARLHAGMKNLGRKPTGWCVRSRPRGARPLLRLATRPSRRPIRRDRHCARRRWQDDASKAALRHMAFAVTRQSGASAHMVYRGDPARPGRAEPLPSIATINRVYKSETGGDVGVFLAKEVKAWVDRVEANGDGSRPYLLAAIAFDATDLEAELYSHPRSHRWSGDVDLHIIDGHNPRPLEQEYIALMTRLDAVIDGTSPNARAAVQGAVNVLGAHAKLAQVRARVAQGKLHAKIQTFARRNERKADLRAAQDADAEDDADDESPAEELHLFTIPRTKRLKK